jgi:cysteine dioxygenase
MGIPLAGHRDEGGFDWSLLAGGLRERSDLARVARVFGSTPLPLATLQRYVRFDRGAYARQRIVRTDAWELLLLCWLPGQASAVHDHDGSTGLVRIVAGSLEESVFGALDGRLPAHTRTVHAGDLLVELPDTIHRVVNAGTRPALSLHLYSPPLPAREAS